MRQDSVQALAEKSEDRWKRTAGNHGQVQGIWHVIPLLRHGPLESGAPIHIAKESHRTPFRLAVTEFRPHLACPQVEINK